MLLSGCRAKHDRSWYCLNLSSHTWHVPKLYGDEAIIHLGFVLHYPYAVGGAIGRVEDVRFLGEVVDYGGLAAGLGTDHEYLEFGEVVHLFKFKYIRHKWWLSFLRRRLGLGLGLGFAFYLEIDRRGDLMLALLLPLLGFDRPLYFLVNRLL